jgi:DNA (cytosine-5)-methyltransferase 1
MPGVNHPDNVHMMRFATMVEKLHPLVLGYDMVPRFLTMGRPLLDRIARYWAKHGYATTVVITDGWQVGLPQHRRRLTVVGHRVELLSHVPKIPREGTRTLKDAIWDLRKAELKLGPQPYPEVKKILTYAQMMRGLGGDQMKYAQLADPASVLVENDVAGHGDDWLFQKAAERGFKHPEALGLRGPRGGKLGFMMSFVDWDKPVGTITSKRQWIHPERLTWLTIREEARLMSYPDWFRLLLPEEVENQKKVYQAYIRLAKAVPPLMAEEACGWIRAACDAKDKLRVELDGSVIIANRMKDERWWV